MKRWLKKWLPDHDSLHRNKSTRWIVKWLHEHPYLLALNRKTVAKGVASGLLVAFIPLPLQILLASLLAILLRANLPIAIALTLISNPFTFVPINLLIYNVGIVINGGNGVGSPPPIHELGLHWESIAMDWQEIVVWFKSLGKSYLIGLVTLSVTASVTSFFSGTPYLANIYLATFTITQKKTELAWDRFLPLATFVHNIHSKSG